MLDTKTPGGDGIADDEHIKALEAKAAAGDRAAQRELNYQANLRFAAGRLLKPHDATTAREVES